MQNLTLIIPAKNEVESLPVFLEEISKLNCKKLIVLQKEDNQTKNVITENESTEILIQKNNGYGNALIEGINESKTEYCCIINADGSMDPTYLNEMLDRLDSLMTNMKQVTDNIAHDLRTPLNRIRTNLEVTLMSNSDVDQYKKSIDDAIIETDNLIKTFNSILSISKVESGASDLDKSVININDLIMNLFDLYEPITDAKGIILNHDVDEEIKIEANNNLLSQAIACLLYTSDAADE